MVAPFWTTRARLSEGRECPTWSPGHRYWYGWRGDAALVCAVGIADIPESQPKPRADAATEPQSQPKPLAVQRGEKAGLAAGAL